MKLLVYSESNLALVRTIFVFVKNVRLHQGKIMGNHSHEKFPQENYKGDNTLYSNRRRSESSMAVEEEE